MTYAPHQVCLLHDPWMILLHTVADALIASAYFAIPLALWSFARRRRDVPFRSLFILFGCFIILCGSTHVGNLLEVWQPIYGTTGVVKLLTAAASWLTVWRLVPMIPVALALPSLHDLQAWQAWALKPGMSPDPALLAELDRLIIVVRALASRP